MFDYNRRQNGLGGGGPPTRNPIVAEVIQVPEMAINLDPVAEVAEVHHLVNSHNRAIASHALP